MPKTTKTELYHKTAQDIHNYDQRILSCLRRIEKDLSEENVSLIQKYHRAMKLETIAKATQLKHLEVMLNLTRFLKKDWKDTTLDDIQNLVIYFMERYSSSGQETNTTADHKKVLKIFFRWLKTGQRKKDLNSLDPIEIRNIRLRRVKDRLSREDLISEEDMTKLLHACGENSRDKALIAVHFESGSRIGETLSLQLKHISLDEHGARIKVDGKTNARPIRLVTSTPYLAQWLNSHPDKNNHDAPLWVNLSRYNFGSQLTYKGARQLIQKRAKIANLQKRVYFHLFRHSQITQTATFLTEAQQKIRYGWSSTSKMPARYTHLTEQDVDDAILRHHGIVKQEKQVQKLPQKCQFCDFPNTPDVKYCEKCGKPLDLLTAMEKDEEKEKLLGRIDALEKKTSIYDEIESDLKQLSVETLDELSEDELLKLMVINIKNCHLNKIRN